VSSRRPRIGRGLDNAKTGARKDGVAAATRPGGKVIRRSRENSDLGALL
jgi:hypothetical protein